MNSGNRSFPDSKSGDTDREIRDFDDRIKSLLENDYPIEYIIEPKVNGLTVQLVYKNGGLTIAFTRNHDYSGEYITANLKTLLTVPLSLVQLDEDCSIPERLAVGGRVYMELEPFQGLNLNRIEKALPPFADPAEAVADSLRQPNPRITAKRPLNMFCSRIVQYEGPPFETEMESMIMLQKWGLRVDRPHLRLYSKIEEVIQYCHYLEEIRIQFPFKLDGALIKINHLRLQKKLFEKEGHPRWAIVFNFK